MKSTFNLNALSVGVLLALGSFAGVAHAANNYTAAGTDINNHATLDYTVGTTPQTPICSSPTGNINGTCTETNFKVDNKVNVTVSAVDSTFVPAVPGGSAVATFLVTNSGNSTQDFTLATANLPNTTALFGGTDNIDPSAACSIFVDGNGNGTYDPLTDTATYIDELAPDASKKVFVVCPFASSVVNKDVAVVSLTATAAVGGTVGTQGAALTATSGAGTAGGVDIVFADGAGSDDAAGAANFSARDAFRIETAELQVTKTVATLCDPVNGATNPMNIPGAFVQYTITVLNKATGLAPASLTAMGDTLASSLTFDPDLIAGTSAAGCVTGGAATSGAGKSFQLSKGGATNGRASLASAVYKTGSTGDTDGAGVVGQVVTLDFASMLPVEAGYTAGQLKVGETVQVKFNVKIN
jgi:hypothetical protein